MSNSKPDAPGLISHETLRFERLLAELSARFINLSPAEVDGAITDALRQIAVLLEVDRAQLIRLAADSVELSHSWAVEGVFASVPPKRITQLFPWSIDRIRSGLAVVVPECSCAPPEAHVDKATWQQNGVRSILGTPMSVAGRVEGAIVITCLRRVRDWPDDLLVRMGVLAEVFANALAHKRARESLDVAIEFERKVSSTLAGLLMAPALEHDRVIEEGLRDMARMLDVEDATLWQRAGPPGEFTTTHRWRNDEASPPELNPARMPWVTAELVAGTVVSFDRHADLPAEAQSDLAELSAHSFSAAVMVPLRVAGAVVGALSFGTSRSDGDWSFALIPRVTLLGEVFTAVLARDAAERREQEASAQAAHAARIGTMGVLAASLVHELTQPLAASLANAETACDLLAEAAPDLDELRATVNDIVADDRRVGDLIQQLRRFLRRGDGDRTELQLRAVIEDVVRLVARDASDKEIEVVLACAQDPLTFVADRVQVQQVLLNLILNGFDAVARNERGARRVEVVARATRDGVSIEVTDHGCGMDELTLSRIFQPFFTTKPGGMGLGLSISQTIVAAHGGKLTVRSTPGVGTTFRMELPHRPPDIVEPQRNIPVRDIAAGIVDVIDDEPSMRRALTRQLQGAGYRVRTFVSAQSYVEHPAPLGVSCIVSDIRMPGLSGLDLQASLAHAERELPIVFVSGHGDVHTTVQAMKAGAVSFLSKPFTKGELLAAVAEAMAKSHALELGRGQRAELQTRYKSLTVREREVFLLVVEGLLNKTIADRLGAAETTIKIHRGRVMDKMGATSLPDLVRMSERLNVRSSATNAR